MAQPYVVKSGPGGSGGGGNPCYRAGTRIEVPGGAVSVENLAAGSLVLTASGESRPVRWLGHRAIDCTGYSDPGLVWPICIRAGSFADQVPSRDLWVSPGHSIFIDGALIQAETLVNGVTILQVPSERVEYWHVELDSHDILLAEGLPAESYLDTGNRTAFVNGGDYLEAHADFRPKHWMETCVPLLGEGPVVENAKKALLARAKILGYAMTDEADVHIRAGGQRIDPVYLSSTRLAFMLPVAGSKELRCRYFVPSHMHPASHDKRAVGVCVSRLQLDGVDVALDDEAVFGHGWHGLERGADGRDWRWSQGMVPLPDQTRLVVIDTCRQGMYWTRPAGVPLVLTG